MEEYSGEELAFLYRHQRAVSGIYLAQLEALRKRPGGAGRE
ncbi:hypothetical protein [Glycomyces artemisiae]|nr:hypothetical protein [Glycomyces artemisiae]